jgi:glycine oxidase
VSEQRPDVAIIGGGPIGLASARLLAEDGASVTVFDAGEPAAAWRFSAGMLTPATEADWGEQAWLEYARTAYEAYPDDVRRLERESGVNVAFRRCDTLALAVDADQRAELLRQFELLHDELGADVEWLDGAACRAAEPTLSPRVVAGMRVTGCGQVDPRRLVEALAAAATRAGAALEQARVDGLRSQGASIELRFADRDPATAGAVVVCAGAWSAAIAGPPAQMDVRPVRGQILRFHGPSGPRHLLHGEGIYLFGRDDGEVVLGASVEEQGFDDSALAGETFRLLEEGIRAVPALREYALTEMGVGLRPGTPDNRPVVGELAPGVFAATGHFRTGILLAFATARSVHEWFSGLPSPAGFATAPAAAHGSVTR